MTSHVKQYLRFCMDMAPDKPIFDLFLCEKRLESFIEFLEKLKKRNNTIANHCKSLEMVKKKQKEFY